MKNIIIFILLLSFIELKAQISLDKDFVTTASYFKTSTNGYFVQNPIINGGNVDNHITIYNSSSYSIYQTVTIPSSIDGYSFIGGVYTFSDNYFDTDPLIEFLASYKNSSNSYRLYAIKEDGSSGIYIDNGYYASILSTIQGIRLVIGKITSGTQSTSIYSFQNNVSPTAIQSGAKMASIPNPYPNPTSDIITLSYDIPAGTTGKIIITNLAGIEVKSYDIGSAFKQIIVNTQDLLPGIYNYSIVSSGGTSQGKSFVVE